MAPKITIHAIAIDAPGAGGSDWFYSKHDADARMTEYENEFASAKGKVSFVRFDHEFDAGTSRNVIESEIDTIAWDRTYTVLREFKTR
ncbi:hypothetical protein D3C87_687340 [compost metagenome]